LWIPFDFVEIGLIFMTRMFQSAINHICVNVSITGNFTKSSAPVSMQEFQIMKVFSINLHPPNAPRIMEVLLVLF
jgi:hypothetical protein